jgi:formylglycine-generating enzyme required for sulfatase activity
MGSNKRRDRGASDNEKPQHEMRLPRYFIARYPVTVAQFRAFVESTGSRADSEGSFQGSPYHPAAGITWYRALDYCAWLTERLREWAGTPELLATLLRDEGWQVTLPSEAEWEKAARGRDGQIYPWGDEMEPNRAHYNMTGIGATSVVGCFPAGASPYGVEDLSGNVWEWTRSLWGDDFIKPAYPYPYMPDDGRKNLEVAGNILRVLRGGAFSGDYGDVRCAHRCRDLPYDRDRSIGFRLVVLPAL